MSDEENQKPAKRLMADADRYEREETTDLKDETPDQPKGWPLHRRILVAMALGVGAGLVVNALVGGGNQRVIWVISNITEPVGQLFLRLLLMIVVPLVFSSLVVGVAGIGDVRKLGRVGLKAFAYTLIISGISVAIGLTLANTVRPGDRIPPATTAALEQRYGSDAARQLEEAQKAGGTDSAMMQVVKSLVPSNPIAALAGVPDNPSKATSGGTPNMLHLMFFALIIGVATTLISGPVVAPFLRGLEALYQISAKVIDLIMKFAPFAVACLLFNNTARFGLDLLGALAQVRHETGSS